MTIEERYAIDYQSLGNGHHTIDFAIDGELFRAMESNEIEDGNCSAHIEMEQSDSGIDVSASINGQVSVACDRCLEMVNIPVAWSGELKIRFSETISDYDGEQLWLARGERLSLAQYLYESVVISLPYRRVHEEGGCNPDMLARFTKYDEVESDN